MKKQQQSNENVKQKKCLIALPTFLIAIKQRRAAPSTVQQVVKRIQHFTDDECTLLGETLDSFDQGLCGAAPS